MSIYFNYDSLNREFTAPALNAWAEFVAEFSRSRDFYKDGWSRGQLLEIRDGKAHIMIEWGSDEEGHREKFEDVIELTADSYFKHYDQLQQKLKGERA